MVSEKYNEYKFLHQIHNIRNTFQWNYFSQILFDRSLGTKWLTFHKIMQKLLLFIFLFGKLIALE